MSNLIKINFERQTTSARKLWEFLDKPYSEFMKWFDKYKSYGFAENLDYRVIEQLLGNPKGGRPAQDYEITIDMAKELCMLQKSEKGKIARMDEKHLKVVLNDGDWLYILKYGDWY